MNIVIVQPQVVSGGYTISPLVFTMSGALSPSRVIAKLRIFACPDLVSSGGALHAESSLSYWANEKH